MHLKIQIIGNIGKDAEVKQFDGGGCAISFNVASTEKYTKGNGETVENTTWVNCTKFVQPGGSTKIADYLKKGVRVMVEGRPSTRAYLSNNNPAASLDCKVSNLLLLSSVNESSQTPAQHRGETVYPPQQVAQQNEPEADDLPF